MLYNVCQKHPTCRDLLRERTRELHDSLERIPVMSRVFDDAFSLDDYRRHLAVLYGVVQPLEARLSEVQAEHGADTLLWRYEPRAAALQADLLQLGVPTNALAQLPATALPAMRDEAEALGVAYVLEGSRLGGKVIHKRLRDYFGDTVPTRYYTATQEPQRWPRFVEVLNSVEDTLRQTRICDAAVATFQCLCDWAASPEGCHE